MVAKRVVHFPTLSARIILYKIQTLDTSSCETTVISRMRQGRSVRQSSSQRLIGWRERHHVSEFKL